MPSASALVSFEPAEAPQQARRGLSRRSDHPASCGFDGFLDLFSWHGEGPGQAERPPFQHAPEAGRVASVTSRAESKASTVVRRRLSRPGRPERRRRRRPSCTGHGWLGVGRTLCLARPRRVQTPLHRARPWPAPPMEAQHRRSRSVGPWPWQVPTDAGQAKGVKEAAQGDPSGRVNLRHHVPCRGGAHALQGHQALRAQRIEVFEAGHQAMFEQLVHQLLSDAVHLECAAPVQHRPRGAGVAHEVITPQEGPVQAKHSATRRTIAWGRNRGRLRQLAFEGPSVGVCTAFEVLLAWLDPDPASIFGMTSRGARCAPCRPAAG